ncbi:MAG: hypothetical protein HW387_1133 [Parachlamydiales bacterium]|nr:hypothetical protein [Parachlamydiales bacterium]
MSRSFFSRKRWFVALLSRLWAFFIIPTQDAVGRGKARSKQSGPNDESIAEGSMDEEEDQSGKAAADRSSVGIVKVAQLCTI